ncbi:sensor histidine kinase [Klebsiella pneumoniae]|uniref:sensor histidine kinase n=1 Tax=Klebsiella pneumoniae TaxID=573 RepID=UPI0029D6A8DB|nr:sensor histidine kinase [Klebsiella pneumoniae]MDX6796429.1 sensor histidine kinase [Klebsiella pneumoniae]HBQ8474225.1 sensor histidine kinase [Klebsiella pneumoniae]HBQ8527931.1 sensor histidine kinase [Klebsiella pneumoniae]HBQ8565178.1 sensor histidine kinase [Klebsiella pneumoniae]HBW6192690.1 sensor histidine kinase [Klebsiella pneumoniae]
MAIFQVAARTLLHLGSELITSDAIAVNELIKNSIDAKSEEIDIFFISPISQEDITNFIDLVSTNQLVDYNSLAESLIERKRIELSDDVCLEFHNKVKRISKLKDKEKVISELRKINYIRFLDSGIGMSEEILSEVFLKVGTNFKEVNDNSDEVYLGNKGIGRLAMMRLGKYSEVTSWRSKDNCNKVYFNWRKFEDPEVLLSDIEIKLEQTNVPCENYDHGTEIIIYDLTHNWTKSFIVTEIINNFLRRLRDPFSENEDEFPINVYFNSLDYDDRLPIDAMSPELWNLAQKVVELRFNPNEDKQIILNISDPKNKDSISPYSTNLKTLAHKFNCTEKELSDIGPFSFKLRWYNRKALKNDILNQSLSSKSKDLHTELDLWSGGIAIYRDGYRIGYSGSQSDKDWFEIDSLALKGQGYTVNRIQLIGSLQITKRYNNKLQDKSNREGLIDNTQVSLVKRIIQEIAIQTFKESINKDKYIKASDRAQNIIDNDVGNAIDKLNKVKETITSLNKNATKEQKDHLKHIQENLHFVSTTVREFESITKSLKDQREDILELAGAGTMVHSVLHELMRSTNQTRELLINLSNETSNEKISSLLIKLESEIKTIDIRLRQFHPIGKAVRNRATEFNIFEDINVILGGYAQKFADNDIRVYVTLDNSPEINDFKIKMVRGFLSIALENLISNSYYWLLKDKIFSSLSKSTERAIYIDVESDTRVIHFSDTGPGIDPNDRERIFDAGFSTKNSEKDGRGFGLFIAREVTMYHGGNLYLSDVQSQEDSRLRHFILELPKNKD